ncbi:MAG: DUF5602 domain-containing protein [Gemmatimonadaceae bacterium]
MKTTPRSICPRHAQAIGFAAASIALASVTLSGCSDSTRPLSDKSGTFYGPVTSMADGTGRTYVIVDRAGVPTDIGLAITEAALTGLPAAKTEYVFALPAEASATAYKHAAINWEPVGHGPTPYLVQHFDFHFYMITNTERFGIVLGDSALAAKMNRQPAAAFVPAGYIVGMAGVAMGMHWRDPEAPELKGGPFTKTFIYGSYDGTFIFGEPMVAKSYLETKPVAVVTPVKLPAQYATSGYQATSYIVGWDAGTNEYRISLSGLVLR